tara:strand:+ start:1678 stop:1926 length:249 start_codon:yes stop_codon:yes gene_type:complete
MNYPKPELNVGRYEVWVWETWHQMYGGKEKWARMHHTYTRKKEALEYVRLTYLSTPPTYVFDRRTGKIVATNEDSLKKLNEK